MGSEGQTVDEFEEGVCEVFGFPFSEFFAELSDVFVGTGDGTVESFVGYSESSSETEILTDFLGEGHGFSVSFVGPFGFNVLVEEDDCDEFFYVFGFFDGVDVCAGFSGGFLGEVFFFLVYFLVDYVCDFFVFLVHFFILEGRFFGFEGF